jgi:1-acyl-sn-glycerol-3-phosphate acyltransferase
MEYSDMRFLYHALHVLTRPVLKSLFKFEVFGAENVPSTKGALLASNHASFTDPIFLGAGLKRNLHYMARSTLFKPEPIDRFLRSLNAFPVHRGAPDRRAIRRALELLDSGNLLLMFAEGTRTYDGTLGKSRAGVGLIAYRTTASVLPVFLGGSLEVLPRGAKMLKLAKVTVSYGKPLDMAPYRASKGSREIYTSIGEELMRRIAELRDRSVH